MKICAICIQEIKRGQGACGSAGIWLHLDCTPLGKIFAKKPKAEKKRNKQASLVQQASQDEKGDL